MNTRQAQPRRIRRFSRFLWMIFGVALVVRVVFAVAAWRQQSPEFFLTFPPDVRQYMALARWFAERTQPAGGGTELAYLQLLRTPGYPTLLAGLMSAGGFPASALGLQVLLASLLPPAAAGLCLRLTRSRSAAIAVGLASALSPTGIGQSALLLTDSLFACLFLFGFLATVRAFASGRFAIAILAGAMLGCALMIRPVLLGWSVVAIAIWWVFRPIRRDRRTTLPLVLILALTLSAPSIWIWHNHRQYGVGSLSSVGSFTVHDYLALRAEASAQQGRLAALGGLRAPRREQANARYARLMQGELTQAGLLAELKSESISILTRHPFWAVLVLIDNGFELLKGWPYAERQLPEPGRARAFFLALGRLSEPIHLIAMFGLLACVIQRRPTTLRDLHRPRRALAFSLLLVVVYFFLASGVSHSQGSRLFYPAEFAALILAADGTTGLVRRAKRRLGKSRPAGIVPAGRPSW